MRKTIDIGLNDFSEEEWAELYSAVIDDSIAYIRGGKFHFHSVYHQTETEVCEEDILTLVKNITSEPKEIMGGGIVKEVTETLRQLKESIPILEAWLK